MSFKVTQYNTAKNCYAHNCLVEFGDKYDHVLESHMDAVADSNVEDAHIVIAKGYEADSADLAIVAVLKKWFGVRYNDGISWRDDLQNLNTALFKGCSYRLVEFGFITNKEERNTFVREMENIAYDIAKAMYKTGGSWLLISGHGEGDPGAVAGGYTEADLVRKMNKKIYDHCQSLIKGVSKQKAPTKIKVTIPNSYRSKKGETVSSIAKRYGLTAAEIRSFNKDLPKTIKEGTFMYLKKQPDKPEQEAKKATTPTDKTNDKTKAVQYQTYKVKKGDSLWKISQTFNVSVDTLVKLNAIKNNAIFIDQVIRIKEVSGTVKQKAPAAAVSNNAITKSEMLKLLETLPGKWIDNDNFPIGARFQCMDVAVWWCRQLTKGTFHLQGNARDAIDNKLPDGWKLIKNEPDTLPQLGDIIIWSKGWADNKYGHIGIVYKNPTLNSVIVAEQNWNGLGNSPVMTRLDYYDGVSYFIRPKTL